ncbi:MAG: Eco57I restriction-modification methylase domain-containing protein [Candidatus Omnitrophota bacterium]
MDKKQAQTLIKETFESPFDKNRFIVFAKNLLNDVEEASFIYRGNFIPDAYEQYVNTLERVGKYSDGEHKIDILIAKLKKETSIERARTMQRNFVAWYLNGSRSGELKDAALVAFVSPNQEDWRFSLVKMDYRFEETKKGRMRVKEEFTPARRWSFLVGVNENSHTAQSQLVDLIADDERNPLLSQLEEAFNIEKVTKEFFEKYRELFLWTEETLDAVVKRDKKIKADFSDKGVNTVDFSKKLLGQIVFLYFLQKKGWFGVKRDADWGTGPKNFLRELFEKKRGTYDNFFNDILEPLFYEALARERDGDFYSRFNCKIPFLNGGLFDPINDYDWVHTDILLPNDLFSNSYKTKEGDKGNGILDIFDRYNFTVKEDEPLEKEVAVDPEMLGKVFENLLEVKDRKSKGTYYTPREIVHYMCVQSLVNYLATELEGKVSKEDCEKLIKHGESVGENEARVEATGKETQTYYYKLPESIRANARLIDQKLADIKICDPAIGSGAFPVGMMTEIVRARNTLSSYIKAPNRTPYNFKRDCIHNSLYGVDIDPGAVEIAKLRLWLSLVVDEDDIRQIKPLPNLEYKIMQGNSLLEEFEGVRLFDDRIIATVDFDKEKQISDLKEKQSKLSSEYIKLHQANKLTQDRKIRINDDLKKISSQIRRLEQSGKKVEENASLFDMFNNAKKKSDALKRLHKEFFETTHKTRKDDLKRQIEKLEWDLIEVTLKEQGKESELKKLEEFKKANIKPFFLWKLHFSEVFQRGGFNIVIANPPYIDGRGLTTEELKALKSIYFSAQGKVNLFNLFQEKVYHILRKLGISTFIIPAPFLRNIRYWAIRKFLLENTTFIEIVDFEEMQFESAVVESILVFTQKQLIEQNQFNVFNNLNRRMPKVPHQDAFIDNAEYKILTAGSEQDLRIISKVKTSSVMLGEVYEVRDGISTGFKPFPELLLGKKQGKTFISLSGNSERFDPKIHKKVIDGGEFNKYTKITWEGRYIRYDKKIEYSPKPKQGRPFNCQLRDRDIFEQNPKICSRQTSNRLIMTLDQNAYYTRNSIHNIYPKNMQDTELHIKYVLALLNSKLLNFIYLKSTQEIGKVHPQVHISDLRKLPIKKIDIKKHPFIDLVEKILSITHSADYLTSPFKQSKVKEYERQIDQMV